MTCQNSEKVSVVIPSFNAGQYLSEAVASALNQTLIPCEVIVVDDGSTDGSTESLAGMAPRVKVLRKVNGGVSSARNLGLAHASGGWIAFLDCDDVWHSAKLELQIGAVRGRPDIVCVFTGAYVYGTESERIAVPESARRGDYSLSTMLFELRAKSSTAMVRASLPVRFPEWTSDCEDVVYFTEIAQLGKCSVIDQPLAGYRRHASNRTKTAAHALGRYATIDRWLSDHPGAPGAESEQVMGRLRGELLSVLEIAKWRRDWEAYWELRNFLVTLRWDAAQPAALNEFVWHPSVYRIKDIFDETRRRLWPGGGLSS